MDKGQGLEIQSRKGGNELLNSVKSMVNFRYVIQVILLLLVINFLLRLTFLLYHFEQAKALTWGQTILSFLVGLRFDIATIFLLNGIIFFFILLPIPFTHTKSAYLISNILILIVNLPALMVNAIDIVYYGLAEKRLTHEFWTTKSDLVNINFKILAGYWYLLLAFGLLIFFFYKILKKFSDASLHKLDSNLHVTTFGNWLLPVLGVGLMYMGTRGWNPVRSLSPESAFVTNSLFAGNLGLNSAWTVIFTIDIKGELPRIANSKDAVQFTRSYVKNSFDGEYVSEKYPLVRKAEFEGEENRYNVVLLILESYSAEHVGILNGVPLEKSLTPNLDTLVRHGRHFTRFYANAVRSVESLPSLFNSNPEIFLRPTIGSRYEENRHWGFPAMLKKRGYFNGFFCGARNGTMGFDHFAEVSGINHYFGMDDYPDKEKDFDGLWGIFDGPFMQWMLKKQNETNGPFFSAFFSVSNHHPFALPANGFEDIKKMEGWDLLKTFVYTDRMIGEYFEAASKQPWFENTIFIITGDHTFHEKSDAGRPFIENFRVPFFIMGPGIEPGLDDRIGDQANLLPTLIELLRLDTWHASSGVSLFDKHGKSFAISNLMEVKGLTLGNVSYSTTFEKPMGVYHWKAEKWQLDSNPESWKNSEIMEVDKKLRYLYQTFQELRYYNSWIGKEFMN